MKQRFFLSYSGIGLPLNLVSPLTQSDVENRNTFFEANYDENDRLIQVRKLIYAEVNLQHDYAYSDEGKLLKADITDEDGNITHLNFD